MIDRTRKHPEPPRPPGGGGERPRPWVLTFRRPDGVGLDLRPADRAAFLRLLGVIRDWCEGLPGG
jgi:hypothetical protein